MNSFPLGHQHFHGVFHIVWGNKNATVNAYQRIDPDCHWIKLKQTHSDIVRVQSRQQAVNGLEGDALVSQEPCCGLLISTADCLPVMFAQPSTGWFAAAHAGWKGVANRIVPKTLEVLSKNSGSKDGIFVWIGPHIQMQSFECGNDVRDEILASAVGSSPTEQTKFFSTVDEGKSLVNLAAIVKFQIQDFGVSLENLWISPEDTKTCSRYHSHRRDREHAGRQISAIVKQPFITKKADLCIVSS